MTEEQRIESIKSNGGLHLKTFNESNRTFTVCLAAVKKDGAALEYVPEKHKSIELVLEAVKQNGKAIEFAPVALKTREVYLRAASSNSEVYCLIPKSCIDADFVIEVARKSDFNSISNLPKEYKNAEFYYELVNKDGHFIWSIPKNKLNSKLCRAAIKSLGFETVSESVKVVPTILSRFPVALYNHDTCLNFVKTSHFVKAKKLNFIETWNDPFSDKKKSAGLFNLDENYNESYSMTALMKWPDVAELVLKKEGRCIRFAKEEILTYKMCKCAVKSFPYAIRYIPEKIISKEICDIAFVKDPYTISCIPEGFIDYDMAKQAVMHSGYVLKKIPVALRTKDVCLIALKSEKQAEIEDVPKELLDKELCLTYLSSANYLKNPLDKIPVELWDHDICLAAVFADGHELERIPKEFVNNETCTAAVKRDTYAAKYVPESLFTEEIANIVVGVSDTNFEFIPRSVLTEGICKKAISHGERSGTVLGLIPEYIITQEMCDMAIEISVFDLKYVPESFVTTEMLISVGKRAAARVIDNFPERLKTKETILKIIEVAPDTSTYIEKYIPG